MPVYTTPAVEPSTTLEATVAKAARDMFGIEIGEVIPPDVFEAVADALGEMGIDVGGIQGPEPTEPEITPDLSPSKPIATRSTRSTTSGAEMTWILGGVAALLGVVTTVAFLVESKRS